MLPQIAGGKADCVEMLWRLALEMRIAVGKDMRAMMQHDSADTAGSIGGKPCMPAILHPVSGDGAGPDPGTDRKGRASQAVAC